MWQRIGGYVGNFWDLRGCRMVWMGPSRSQVAFWRLFLQSAFKRKPTGKSTGGHMGSTQGLQEDVKSSFEGFEGVRVGEKGI